MKRASFIILKVIFCINGLFAQAESNAVLKVFCFPEGKIPAIDANTADWNIVPDNYALTIHDMKEDEGKHLAPDIETLDVKIKVGWAKGENRLYFLYEAYDNYWSFTREGLEVDILEVVVDGDRSGGPFIARFYPFKDVSEEDAWNLFQGRHAQNYHIYTPAKGDDWCWYWGPQQWLKQEPFSKYAYNYDFKEGENGKLILEFYITPFDYASPKGYEHSVVSDLYENKLIGLCWAVIDHDNSEAKGKDGFWNLSPHHKMYGDASLLRTFRLMPEEK